MDWSDKGDLIEKLCQARKEARDTCPHKSHAHDAAEAAMFIAMLDVMFADGGDQEAEPVDPAPTEPPPNEMTDEIPPEEAPKRRRGKDPDNED